MINKLISNIFRKTIEDKYISQWLAFAIDLLIIAMASTISYMVANQIYKNLSVLKHPELLTYLLLTLFCHTIFGIIFKTNKGIIRYSSVLDFQRIFLAFFCSDALVFIVLYNVLGLSGSVSMAYCLLLFLINMIAALGFRMSVVIVYQQLVNNYSGVPPTPLYIWGIDEHNLALSKVLNMTQNRFKLKGFISTSSDSRLDKLTSYKVLHARFPHKLAKMKLGKKCAVLFTDMKDLKDNSSFVEELLRLKIAIYRAQLKDIESINSLSDTETRIKSVQIEDLLGRPEIDISIDAIGENVNGKTILVTGASGSIGSEIVRQLSTFSPANIICFDQAETPLNSLYLELSKAFPKIRYTFVLGNIRNIEAITNVFKMYNPDILYHAAAYKHVPILEVYPCEAIMSNVMGTKMLVDLSIEYNVSQFVMISTDKAVNPTNVMGCSKRIAEIYVQSVALSQNKNKKGTAFITTRFGNVLGSNGSVIPLFKEQIECGGPLTVTHPEITRYFMTIPEACKLVLESSIIGKSGYIYVFDMGSPVKILDMAEKMIELAGHKPYEDIDIIFSGLRAGEKLYEELLNEGESTIPTTHEKVMVAKVREYNFSEIESTIEQMIFLAQTRQRVELVSLMKKLVPEFISQNSEFEYLDK